MNSNKPFVSVIIPAYNAAAYIKEAIDSALAQTYQEKEIIVVDDGSKDNIAAVVEPYIKEGKIVYIKQENKGLSGARNTGIRNAKGEFIALLDADDMFLPTKLERQVGYLMDHPECSVCYCDVIHFYEEEPQNPLHLNYDYYSGDKVFPALLKKNFINPLSVVFRKSVFDKVGLFDEAMRQYAEDWELWLRAAHAGLRFDHVPEELARYRMRKLSLSYNRSLEVTRKRTVVGIFKKLYGTMSSAERAKFHMNKILWRHRLRLWYAELAAYIPLFAWVHQKIQKKRLASAS